MEKHVKAAITIKDIPLNDFVKRINKRRYSTGEKLDELAGHTSIMPAVDKTLLISQLVKVRRTSIDEWLDTTCPAAEALTRKRWEELDPDGSHAIAAAAMAAAAPKAKKRKKK